MHPRFSPSRAQTMHLHLSFCYAQMLSIYISSQTMAFIKCPDNTPTPQPIQCSDNAPISQPLLLANAKGIRSFLMPRQCTHSSASALGKCSGCVQLLKKCHSSCAQTMHPHLSFCSAPMLRTYTISFTTASDSAPAPQPLLLANAKVLRHVFNSDVHEVPRKCTHASSHPVPRQRTPTSASPFNKC